MLYLTWRYFRNLFFLALATASSLVALRFAALSPINWLWGIPIFYLAFLVLSAFRFTHPPRMRDWSLTTPSLDGIPYEKVLFKSRDGLTLFGWYLPGKSSAAVILVHGLGGSGRIMEVYATFLARAGYHILLLDLRAHGSSDGDTSTYGVLEAHDIAGAADFLRSRGSVEAGKIGVLGISLGAQSALRGALQTSSIGALVLEGLGPAHLQDRIRPANPEERSKKTFYLRNRLVYALKWLEQWIFNFFSGHSPSPLKTEIGKIAPRPVLLIACGRYEIEFNRLFCAAAQGPCTLWELPQAKHAAALPHAPHEYTQRVLAFFNQALSETSPSIDPTPTG